MNPPKRRRLSVDSSEPAYGLNLPFVYAYNKCSESNNNINDNINNINNNYYNPQNNNHTVQQIEEFKSQLTQVLEVFPPFIDVITIQNNPEIQLAELFQVFSADKPFIHSLSQSNQSHSSSQKPIVQNNNDNNDNNNNTLSPYLPLLPTLPPLQLLTSTDQTTELPTELPTDSYDLDLYENKDDITMFRKAKTKMINLLQKNIDYRCKKIIESLNKTTKNDSKMVLFLKHFELNEIAEREILKNLSLKLEEWKGGNYKEKLKDQCQYYKKIRAHWNRQKSQQLGDELFCVILDNLFKVSLEINGLSLQQQVIFYINLFQNMLKEKIQFNQSMPRPLVPNACFDKASLFKRLCENILQVFGRGNIKWTNIRTTKSVKNTKGVTVTKYVKNGMRSQILAETYYKCLQDIKSILLKESNDFMQHSIHMHLKWMEKTLGQSSCLIKWKPLIHTFTSTKHQYNYIMPSIYYKQ